MNRLILAINTARARKGSDAERRAFELGVLRWCDLALALARRLNRWSMAISEGVGRVVREAL